MRICLISAEYPPETGFGGIGTYTYNLAHGMTKLGHDVTVITKAISNEKLINDRGVKVYRIFDRKVPFKGFTRISNLLSNGGFGYFWHSRSVFSKIKQLIDQQGEFDVIEGPLWDVECLAYHKKINAPLIVRLQTPIFKSREILNLKPNKVLENLEKLSLAKATAIIAISKNIKEVVGNYYNISKNKIKVCYLGVSIPNIKKPIFKKNSYKLLYVGRLEKRKGTTEFIESLKEILQSNPKIRVDIIGKDIAQAPGKIFYKEYFKKVVPESLKSRVKFHGFVDQRELQAFYKNCDLFIAPSRYESFGLIFLEAMIYGKPVIGTRAGAIPEIVADGKAGILVEVNSPEQIANAVLKVFANENLRNKMANKAFEYVRENFTTDKMIENTLIVYKKAIKDFKRSQNAQSFS